MTESSSIVIFSVQNWPNVPLSTTVRLLLTRSIPPLVIHDKCVSVTLLFSSFNTAFSAPTLPLEIADSITVRSVNVRLPATSKCPLKEAPCTPFAKVAWFAPLSFLVTFCALHSPFTLIVQSCLGRIIFPVTARSCIVRVFVAESHS